MNTLFARTGVPIAILGLAVLTGCGSSSSPSNTGHINGTTYNRTNACKSNQFVGNRKTHALHRPGARNLPASKNQVCFNSLAAGQQAGYHLGKHG